MQISKISEGQVYTNKNKVDNNPKQQSFGAYIECPNCISRPYGWIQTIQLAAFYKDIAKLLPQEELIAFWNEVARLKPEISAIKCKDGTDPILKIFNIKEVRFKKQVLILPPLKYSLFHSKVVGYHVDNVNAVAEEKLSFSNELSTRLGYSTALASGTKIANRILRITYALKDELDSQL